MGFQKWMQLLFTVVIFVALLYTSFYVLDIKSDLAGIAETLKGLFSSSTIGYGA